MTTFDLNAYIAARMPRILAGLERFTPAATASPALLHEAMRYSLLGGSSKRIRPLLCLAGAEAIGGDPDPVLPTACALEMIHTFSLIHDDLPAMDDDDYRRGQLTCHKVYGEAMAILAGDALHTLAFGTIATHQKAKDPHAIIEVLWLLAEATGTAGMVGGQVDDIHYERKPVTAEILRTIHERKTGALLNASILAGAILAGATEDQRRALKTYGDKVGLAFQIVDDILDVVGDEATIGKPVGSDVKNDKATYPKVYGLEKSRELAFAATDAALAALASFNTRADPLRAFARYIIERKL